MGGIHCKLCEPAKAMWRIFAVLAIMKVLKLIQDNSWKDEVGWSVAFAKRTFIMFEHILFASFPWQSKGCTYKICILGELQTFWMEIAAIL